MKKAILTYQSEGRELSNFLSSLNNYGDSLTEQYNTIIFSYVPVIYNDKPGAKVILEEKYGNNLEKALEQLFKEFKIPDFVNNNSDFIIIERALSQYYKRLERKIMNNVYKGKTVVDIKKF